MERKNYSNDKHEQVLAVVKSTSAQKQMNGGSSWGIASGVSVTVDAQNWMMGKSNRKALDLMAKTGKNHGLL